MKFHVVRVPPAGSIPQRRNTTFHLLIALFVVGHAATAQPADTSAVKECISIRNESYGNAEPNRFDMFVPKSEKPTPLVIWIHGGGFVMGDKAGVIQSRREDVLYFLKNNVAFATLNYCYAKQNDSLGVEACLKDIQTALQYIRHHASRFNIDKNRIACYGISAGAGSSLYLALHDDLAVKNDTSLLGESTRITCAGALATQATYDVFRWIDYIPGMDSAFARAKEPTNDAAAKFYGYPTYEAFEPHRAKMTHDLDMLRMISSDDPPVYVMNLQKDLLPRDMNTVQHHRAHALILDKYLKMENVEHETYVYSDSSAEEKDVRHPVREFLVEHLQRQVSGSR
jgi:acetyl esterase/lipase